MAMSHVFRAISASAALAVGAAFVLTPLRAQDQTITSAASAPCRIIWDGQTAAATPKQHMGYCSSRAARHRRTAAS